MYRLDTKAFGLRKPNMGMWTESQKGLDVVNSYCHNTHGKYHGFTRFQSIIEVYF